MSSTCNLAVTLEYAAVQRYRSIAKLNSYLVDVHVIDEILYAAGE